MRARRSRSAASAALAPALAAAMLAGGLAACSFGQVSPSATSGPAGASSGLASLTISQTTDADRLDPLRTASNESRAILLQLFDPLFHAAPDGRITGVLAKSWTFDDTGTELTVELHPGVKFRNGAAVDAAAVKYTIEQMLSPTTWPAASLLSSISSVTAPSATQVVIQTKAPDPLLLGYLADNVFPVDPADHGSRSKEDLAANPTAAGPTRSCAGPATTRWSSRPSPTTGAGG